MRASAVVLVLALSFGENSLNLACVISMTKMLSLSTMLDAVSSVNCWFTLPPMASKNVLDFSRSLTGRLTKILLIIWASPFRVSGPCAFLMNLGRESSQGADMARRNFLYPLPEEADARKFGYRAGSCGAA